MNKTISYYENNAEKYIEDTLTADTSEIRNKFLQRLRGNGTILDLGCGSGRDSKAFLENGYSVVSVDGTKRFVEETEKLLGTVFLKHDQFFETRKINFEEMDFIENFDGIFACASLLHLPKKELPEVFQKIKTALKKGGVFYCSFKHGDFEGERNGRYFTYLTEKELEKIAEPFFGKPVELWLSGDVRSGRGIEQWVNGIFEN